MTGEYRVTWNGLAGETMEELFEGAPEAALRIADLRAQNAPQLTAEVRPVGQWQPASLSTITTDRERATSALMNRNRTPGDREFIRGQLEAPADAATATFRVDTEARIVKLLYPELAE